AAAGGRAPRRRRPARRHRVSFGGGPHREASVPRAGRRGLRSPGTGADPAWPRRGQRQPESPEREATRDRASGGSMRVDQRPVAAASAAWIGAFGASGQQAARFHREADHRLRRAMMAALVSAALLVGGVLGIVALKVHQVRLSYRLDALRSSKASLEEQTRLLRVELATLRSLARIEGKARAELGMVPPGKNQVLLAREFVAGGSGLGMASGRQTAFETKRFP